MHDKSLALTELRFNKQVNKRIHAIVYITSNEGSKQDDVETGSAPFDRMTLGGVSDKVRLTLRLEAGAGANHGV